MKFHIFIVYGYSLALKELISCRIFMEDNRGPNTNASPSKHFQGRKTNADVMMQCQAMSHSLLKDSYPQRLPRKSFTLDAGIR